MSDLAKDIHQQLRELLDANGAIYRVVEHEPEGRTEFIAKNSRQSSLEQAIKSMVVQVRFGKKESCYYLANVPGHCRVDLAAFNPSSMARTRLLRRVKKPKR